MSIWRDIYLAMPKGERFEFAKRTLGIPHFKIQTAADLVFADASVRGTLDAFSAMGVVAPPWNACIAEFKDNHGDGILVGADAIRVRPGEERKFGNLSCRLPGAFLVGFGIWSSAWAKYATVKPSVTVLMSLTADGRVFFKDNNPAHPDLVVVAPPNVRDNDLLDIGVSFLSRIVLTAFGLAHCKNVKVEETTEPAPKCMRREGFPDAKVTYRTLAIGGPAKSARKRLDEDGDEASIQRALHICRGHFAEYGPEAPLFGKHTGQFWVPQHVRGTEKAGRVVKDYEVKKPEGRA